MGSSENTQLKLLAIVLPEPVFSFVIEQQTFIANTWGPRRALRTPPHLTLVPPLMLSPPEEHVLSEICEKAALEIPKFNLTFCSFDHFPEKVVFLKPKPSEELQNLYKTLNDEAQREIPHAMKRYSERQFYPHVTLAHRDVTPDKFQNIKSYYDQVSIHVVTLIDKFHILSHTSQGWKIGQTFPLR